MSVYLIQAGENGPIKIGRAVDPERRLRGLQCAHYETLTLRRVWPGDWAEEVALHRAFADFRIRGEWHRLAPGMLDTDPAMLLAQQVKPLRECSLGRQIVEALGGRNAVARLTGKNTDAVRAWYRIGVPVREWPKLLEEASRIGAKDITVDALAYTRPQMRAA